MTHTHTHWEESCPCNENQTIFYCADQKHTHTHTIGSETRTGERSPKPNVALLPMETAIAFGKRTPACVLLTIPQRVQVAGQPKDIFTNYNTKGLSL